MRHIGEQHINGTGTGVQKLTVPVGATIAHICAEGGDLRYSFDATPAHEVILATQTTGTPLLDGKERYLFDKLSAFHWDAVAGTYLHVNYFKE